MQPHNLSESRRRFLQFLAASPLFSKLYAEEASSVLAKPEDALNVMEFQETAHRALTPAHWGYMSSGVDDDLTLKANLAAFKRIQLRPRRLVDVSKTDMRVDVFGSKWDSPMYISAVGGQMMFHPDGELGTARAARA